MSLSTYAEELWAKEETWGLKTAIALWLYTLYSIAILLQVNISHYSLAQRTEAKNLLKKPTKYYSYFRILAGAKNYSNRNAGNGLLCITFGPSH